MNKIILFILLLISFIIISCNESSTPSEMKNEQIELYNMNLKGCLKTVEQDPYEIIYGKDTVIVSSTKDSTKLIVNLHYTCKWKFDHTYEIASDTLYLSIIDTCTTNCGAWCYCDYIFEYNFSNLLYHDFIYKAEFKSLQDDSRIIGIGRIK